MQRSYGVLVARGHRELDKPTEGSGKVSGSERRKAKPWNGPQDITNGRVAEMIEVAAVLTNHPDAIRPSATLARIADELLKKGSGRATIDQAIEAAPSRGIAQTLQHAVEAASERIVICRNEVRAELLLFAIPIITTFEQNVPESQFESALNGLSGLKDSATSMREGSFETAPIVLLPKLFRLDELNAMPLSIVRERGVNLGTAARVGPACGIRRSRRREASSVRRRFFASWWGSDSCLNTKTGWRVKVDCASACRTLRCGPSSATWDCLAACKPFA